MRDLFIHKFVRNMELPVWDHHYSSRAWKQGQSQEVHNLTNYQVWEDKLWSNSLYPTTGVLPELICFVLQHEGIPRRRTLFYRKVFVLLKDVCQTVCNYRITLFRTMVYRSMYTYSRLLSSKQLFPSEICIIFLV